jgi:RNA polymerase sigma-70 factor (ECF subfamily)
MVKRKDQTAAQAEEEIMTWVEQAQDGNEDSFANLYSHYYPLIHRRIWHMVPQADVDDVTQEVFLAVIKSLHSFRGDAKFSTWLHTLTSRQVVNYYRQRERSPEQVDEQVEAMEAQAAFSDHKQDLRNQEEMIVLQRGITKLSEDYQEVLLLRFADGLPFKDIAEQLGKSLDATKSLFRRALAALKNEIGS